MALHATSKLLRRLLRLVGNIPFVDWGRWSLDFLQSVVDVDFADESIGRDAAGKRHQRATTGIRGLQTSNQQFFSVAARKIEERILMRERIAGDCGSTHCRFLVSKRPSMI